MLVTTRITQQERCPKKISVGGISNSKEVCICKVDINYSLFFAQALWQSKSILSKYKSILYIFKVQNYTFKVQNYAFKVQKHTFNLQKHTFKVQKYMFKVQKQPFKVQKYTFKVQNYAFKVQKLYFQYMPLGTHRTPKPSKPRARNLLNPEQCLGSGTRFLPETAPARPERTEIYIVQRPQSILPLGEKKKTPKNWMFQSKFRSQKTTSRIPPPRQPKKKKNGKNLGHQGNC